MSTPSRHPAAIFVAGLLLSVGAGCASLRSGVQSAYNDDVVGRMADTLVGAKWVTYEEPLPPITYSGRYTVLVFFDPRAKASATIVDDLVTMHRELTPKGVVFFGVTDADAESLGFFTDEKPLPFSVLTEAPADRMNFRIKKLYEPEILVVDPYGRIVADGIDDSWSLLRQKL